GSVPDVTATATADGCECQPNVPPGGTFTLTTISSVGFLTEILYDWCKVARATGVAVTGGGAAPKAAVAATIAKRTNDVPATSFMSILSVEVAPNARSRAPARLRDRKSTRLNSSH